MSDRAEQLSGYTYGDYLGWSGDERWELIEGRAYSMSPAPSTGHQHVSAALTAQLFPLVSSKQCHVFAAPFDVRLPRGDESDEEIDTVVQPDLVVICAGGRGTLDDRGCRGAPDLVVEVLSPSTAARDQIIKRALYEKHGVRELRLVHPVDRLVTVSVLGDDGAFAPSQVRETRGRQPLSIFSDLEIDWDSIWETMPGEPAPKPGRPPPSR